MEIIRNVAGEEAFSNDDYLLVLREERENEQKNWDDENDAPLKVLVGDLIGTDQRYSCPT